VAQSFFPTEEQYDQYWAGQARRSQARANSAIDPIFAKYRDKITTDLLDVLNNRRYLKIQDPKKRLRAVRRDPKLQQVSAIILKANEESLQAIYDNFDPHYQEEVPMICKRLYPWWPGDCTAEPLNNKELTTLASEPFLGRTWRSWILGEPKLDGNAQQAQKRWESEFRAVMSGEIRTDKSVSRDVQLVRSARNIMTTNQSRNKTVFENAMITTARKALADVEGAIWPSA